MGCKPSKEEADFRSGIHTNDKLNDSMPGTSMINAPASVSKVAGPRSNTGSQLKDSQVNCHNQNKYRQAVPTMGISSMLSPATASRKAAKITARTNRPLKRLNPTRSTESQDPPIIWPFTRSYSCLKSEPAIPISTEPAMFIRSLTTDSLSSDNPLRELPEVTITFNISQSLGIDIERYLGLVLDERAIIKRVLGSTQAASANVQPSWRMRWIEVEQNGQHTSIAVSSRKGALEIFAECSTHQRSSVSVVFACPPGTDLRNDDSMLSTGVGIAFSRGDSRRSVDSDYTPDDAAVETIRASLTPMKFSRRSNKMRRALDNSNSYYSRKATHFTHLEKQASMRRAS